MTISEERLKLVETNINECKSAIRQADRAYTFGLITKTERNKRMKEFMEKLKYWQNQSVTED